MVEIYMVQRELEHRKMLINEIRKLVGKIAEADDKKLANLLTFIEEM